MRTLLKALKRAYLSIDSAEGYLYKSGWLETLRKGQPCNAIGLPIPWMNLAVISFLEDNLNNNLSVLEFGGGNSTLFFSRYCHSVVTIEHDPDWYQFLLKQSPENCNIILAENKSYYLDLSESCPNQKWDVVVVDGIHRVECINNLEKYTLDSSIVIVDDSSRPQLTTAIQKRISTGKWKKIRLPGVCNGSHRLEETTILYQSRSFVNF